MDADGYASSIKDKILSINVKPGWKEGTKVIFPKEGDQVKFKEHQTRQQYSICDKRVKKLWINVAGNMVTPDFGRRICSWSKKKKEKTQRSCELLLFHQRPSDLFQRTHMIIKNNNKRPSQRVLSLQGPNKIPADIVFIVRQKSHPLYVRQDNDLIYKIQISLEMVSLCT